MEDLDHFTEDEIKEQLEILGYSNVPPERIQEFKRDLEQMVRSKNSSLLSASEQSSSESDFHPGRPNGISHPYIDRINHGTSVTEHQRYGKENIYPPGPSHAEEDPRHAWGADPLRGARLDPTTGEMGGMAQDTAADTTLDSTTSTERRTIKRKVLRKRDGHTEIYETESESGDLESIEERLRNLPLSLHLDRPATTATCRQHSVTMYQDRRPYSARESAPVFRLPEDYDGLKALIRPMRTEPHKQNVKKSDPVSRGQQYRTSWQQQRAPGEKSHKNLRWGIREQMLYHDVVVDKSKQQKVFIPNHYVVPTDKKRKNLRWQIRNDLAQGVVPPSMFD